MRHSLLLATAATFVVAACTGDSVATTPDAVTTPSTDVTTPVDTSSESLESLPPVVLSSFVIGDAAGRVALVDDGGVARPVRDDDWHQTISLDGTFSVSTTLVGPGNTKIAWDALPSGDVLGGTVLPGADMEATATQVGGNLTAFVNRATPITDDSIAGGRDASTIVLASPEGEVARYELDGNVVPEAIGSNVVDGMPTQLFLLEYLPAEAPTRYRVRTLDTATGTMALPLNLRDKVGPAVDQEMAGVTRGQVLASEHGYLFTLYRGTSDMPGGHPYAFVHTLDLYDGVWCLGIPPEMELEHLPGAIAAFGDRLYVASANGMVGAYDIAVLPDASMSADMIWTTRIGPVGGTDTPAIAAGPDGAVVAWPAVSGLHTVDPDGVAGPSVVRAPGVEALTLDNGRPVAVGGSWWDLGSSRPDWLAGITRVVAFAG
jgi:hypothetical protein